MVDWILGLAKYYHTSKQSHVSTRSSNLTISPAWPSCVKAYLRGHLYTGVHVSCHRLSTIPKIHSSAYLKPRLKCTVSDWITMMSIGVRGDNRRLDRFVQKEEESFVIELYKKKRNENWSGGDIRSRSGSDTVPSTGTADWVGICSLSLCHRLFRRTCSPGCFAYTPHFSQLSSFLSLFKLHTVATYSVLVFPSNMLWRACSLWRVGFWRGGVASGASIHQVSWRTVVWVAWEVEYSFVIRVSTSSPCVHFTPFLGHRCRVPQVVLAVGSRGRLSEVRGKQRDRFNSLLIYN